MELGPNGERRLHGDVSSDDHAGSAAIVPRPLIGYFKSVQEFFVNPVSSHLRSCRIRSSTALAATGLAAIGFAVTAGLGRAYAAPMHHAAKVALPAAKTLTFDVSARLSSNGSDSATTLSSKVWAKGSRVRIETSMGDRAVVFLAAPPYLYKLIPAAKAGVRWKSAKLSTGRFDIASLFDPTAIRAQLQARGAKPQGTETVNGTVTEIYQAGNVGGRGTDIKAWLRRGDALPLRVETHSKSLNSVVTWTNYRHNTSLAETLFQVPAGYNVRDSQGKPGLF